jgi:hypothetical protein
VPTPEAALGDLPALLAFLKDPGRLRIRLDPLLRLADGRDNVASACALMREAAALGAVDFVTSIVTPYAKIGPRLASAGLSLLPWSAAERCEIIARLSEQAQSLGIRLAGCCLPELPQAACIDGLQLQALHPARLPCRLDHPAGQRRTCGCTHAVDLGWYSSHPCFSGCLYCYANPKAPPASGAFPPV